MKVIKLIHQPTWGVGFRCNGFNWRV